MSVIHVFYFLFPLQLLRLNAHVKPGHGEVLPRTLSGFLLVKTPSSKSKHLFTSMALDGV